jgi:hypothetical protein
VDLDAGHRERVVGAEAGDHELLVVHAGQAVVADQHDLALDLRGVELAVDDVREAHIAAVAGEVARRPGVVDQYRARPVGGHAPGLSEGRASVRHLEVRPRAEVFAQDKRTIGGEAEGIDDGCAAGASGKARWFDGERNPPHDAIAVEDEVRGRKDDVGIRVGARDVGLVVGVGAAECLQRYLVDALLHDLAAAHLRAARAVGENDRHRSRSERLGEGGVLAARVGEPDVKADHLGAGLLEVDQRLRVKVAGERVLAELLHARIVDADHDHARVGRALAGEPVLWVD